MKHIMGISQATPRGGVRWGPTDTRASGMQWMGDLDMMTVPPGLCQSLCPHLGELTWSQFNNKLMLPQALKRVGIHFPNIGITQEALTPLRA